MKNKKKGFTLAELLIVVAIIAVLVAISIPVFSKQLEKSRESTDLANVRSAYAAVMTSILSDDVSATYQGNKIYQGDGLYEVVVSLEQTQEGWQSSLPITIGGITSSDSEHWIGQPGNTCTISYTEDTGVVFTWNGQASSNSLMNTVLNFSNYTNGTWNGSGSARVTNQNSTYYHTRRSTSELVQLDANSSYTLTYTVPAGYDGQNVEIGTLLFTEGTGHTSITGDTINSNQKADSGWISSTVNSSNNASKNYQTVTVNSDGSKTVTQTINTDATHVYFGANFRVSPVTETSEDGTKTYVEQNLTENPAYEAAVVSSLQSLTLTKN